MRGPIDVPVNNEWETRYAAHSSIPDFLLSDFVCSFSLAPSLFFFSSLLEFQSPPQNEL